ncbi:MAG: imidazole glycerol phosphate synthase subunit HisH [Pseudomonadota bacterium]
MQIAVVDLGIGNLRSVKQALSHVAPDADVIVTDKQADLLSADKIVLPGQGAVGSWFQALHDRELRPVIQKAIEQKPMLGICVGMQALFSFCEEDGGIDGLGVFDGEVRHFRNFHPPLDEQQQKMKIPQMGWNRVQQRSASDQSHPLWQGIEDHAYFYFVHSYCANSGSADTDEAVYGLADYGHEFIAAVGRGSLFAVQFHPEKSHQDGLQLLKNFARWNGES